MSFWMMFNIAGSLALGLSWVVIHYANKRRLASGDDVQDMGNSLTLRNRADLTSIAERMGVTPGMALEIAINRLTVSIMKLREGDVANVDFRQSIKTAESGQNATSNSLPGFGQA